LRAVRFPPTIFCLALVLLATTPICAQTVGRDREIAGRFAPVFYQAIGDNARSDYITNFDFDGDWRGDNNWDNVANKRYPLKAYVYYSVAETTTHFLIHYALFHARDYKGGTTKGRILSEILREGTDAANEYDPTGMAIVATVAHENDLEGCVVVVEKSGNDFARARVVYVATLAHNKFFKYTASESENPDATLAIVDRRPLLYVEPKGHGVENYVADHKQSSAVDDSDEPQSETMDSKNKDSDKKSKDKKSKKKDIKESRNGLVVYRFTGGAEQPDKVKGDSCGYDLVPIQTTLWKHAQAEANETYGTSFDYQEITISIVSKGGGPSERKVKIGMRGFAFLGKKGGQNIARAPWGWFDVGDKSQPLGIWFFDPAKAIKRHFKLDEAFSTVYVRHPILGVGN
jgi:hypothetical protein